MNRFTFLFALLVASSFAVPAPQSGERTSAMTTAVTPAATDRKTKAAMPEPSENAAKKQGPVPFLQAFLAKALDKAGPGQAPTILFATVPHPLETHLAAQFDHDLDALQDALQESGYLFDSSWIPWKLHDRRELYKDDESEVLSKVAEDGSPGILLFRSADTARNPFLNGAVVFLITEKPTQGIALAQVKMALDIANSSGLALPATIRILGPMYSGSFVTLVRMASLLADWDPTANFVIRSADVSVGSAACDAVREMSNRLPGRSIDFGSAMHDQGDRLNAVLTTLDRMGVAHNKVAVLAEEDSLYGYSFRQGARLRQVPQLAFPRDISSLRAGYESQGIFSSNAPAEPWKRLLNLHSDEQGEGDSVRSFGGASTVTSQEGILLGISEFVRRHGVHAVVIAATNHDDLYFLAQFLHAHNGAVRVVMLGNSRNFARVLDGEFRGDLIVDEYPMLPWLGDWTGAGEGGAKHFFADDVAEGTYFAGLDLLHEAGDHAPHWVAEYSMPLWDRAPQAVLRPPLYLVALGSKSTWPLAIEPGNVFPDPKFKQSVQMPFRLFGSDPEPPQPLPPGKFGIGPIWRLCLAALVLITACYSACFWIADPVNRIMFAGFQPSSSWRFWLLKVMVPAAVAGAAFHVLAWSVEIPKAASDAAAWYWHCVELLTILAPLAIALSAAVKALTLAGILFHPGMAVAGLPFLYALIHALVRGILARDPFAGRDAGSIMNTYREMHFDSGLSLVPTLLLLLAAIVVWASQAGSGNALLDVALPLPAYPENQRISRSRGENIVSVGRPLPPWRAGKVLWISWSVVAAVVLFLHESIFFKRITTLETHAITRVVLCVSVVIVLLLLLDLVQFVQLWEELRGLLRALHRQTFRRSFVPITEFKWPTLWSFSGASFRDRKALDWALSRCVFELHFKHEIADLAQAASGLNSLKRKYSTEPLPRMNVPDFNQDRKQFLDHISDSCKVATALIRANAYAPLAVKTSPAMQALQRIIGSFEDKKDAFASEREQVSLLPEQQQTAERLICLVYIGFIQTVVARLHTLLMSVALMFSLLVVAMAIYPFVPFAPLLLAGCALLAAIALGFLKVFSELNRDAILSRIVNQEEGKLQTNFYLKLAEALALPMLALASSVLPGGTGRILELLSSLINHAQ